MVICTCLILQSEPVLYLNLKLSFVLCQIEFVLCQIANCVGVLLSRFHSYPAKYEARLSAHNNDNGNEVGSEI